MGRAGLPAATRAGAALAGAAQTPTQPQPEAGAVGRAHRCPGRAGSLPVVARQRPEHRELRRRLLHRLTVCQPVGRSGRRPGRRDRAGPRGDGDATCPGARFALDPNMGYVVVALTAISLALMVLLPLGGTCW